MTEATAAAPRKVLAFTAIVEVATGLALIVDPAVVIALLLGTNEFGRLLPLVRAFGIALLGLGLACWPGRADATIVSPALRGMLVYNTLIALLLAYLGGVERAGGLLLWPAAALHAIVALGLARSRLAEARNKTAG